MDRLHDVIFENHEQKLHKVQGNTIQTTFWVPYKKKKRNPDFSNNLWRFWLGFNNLLKAFKQITF